METKYSTSWEDDGPSDILSLDYDSFKQTLFLTKSKNSRRKIVHYLL